MSIFKISVPSTSDWRTKYTITVDNEKKTVECTCKGCLFTARCKHIKYYKVLIKELMEAGDR